MEETLDYSVTADFSEKEIEELQKVPGNCDVKARLTLTREQVGRLLTELGNESILLGKEKGILIIINYAKL